MPKTHRLVRAKAAIVVSLLLALACAIVSSVPAQAETALDDGTYQVDVTLQGGSGRASVDSPTTLSVSDGAMTVTIVWSSPHYDYMLVDGERYLPTNTEGNSTFEVPVTDLSEPLSVVADTTAMSQPHEIDYQLLFDPATITPTGRSRTGLIPAGVIVALVAGLFALGVILRHRRAAS